MKKLFLTVIISLIFLSYLNSQTQAQITWQNEAITGYKESLPNGKILKKTAYVYDSKNQLLSREITTYDSNKNVLSRTKYGYNNKLELYFVYIFNEKNQIIEETLCYTNDYNGTTHKFQYDKNGTMIVGEEVTIDKRLIGVTESDIFDKKKKKIENIRYYSDKKIAEKRYFDKKGNPVKIEYYDTEKIVKTEVLEYDKNDKLVVKKTFEGTDYLAIEESFSYDTAGNMVSKKESLTPKEDQAKISIYNYKYDENNNVIKEEKLDFNTNQLIRQTEYYYQ